jgi:protein ImuB
MSSARRSRATLDAFEVAAPGKKPRVTQLDARARRAGVRPGMTAAQARAVSANVRLFTATAADHEAGAAALADVGYAFAPRVESGDGGERVFFDCADLGQLYPYGEQAIAQAIQAHAARLGLGARVAIASSKGIARVATRAHALAVVPADAAGARAFLAPLHADLLTDDAELRAAFRRWGTRTAGAVAALPADAVALRLGRHGADVARLASGKDDEPFAPRLPPDALEEAVELDYPVHEIEPLAFVLRGLCDRALARLAGRSLACAGMTLRLALDPRGLDVRAVPLAAPTRDAKTVLELVRLDLARRPPAAAVVGARIIVEPARVRATQLDMLRPAGPAPDRLATTLARLTALVGPDNVGAPATVDSWREQAVAVTPYAPPAAPPAGDAAAPPSAATRLTIRRRRPPEEIEVIMGRDGPTALRGSETTARVLISAGPYRLSGEWWQPAAAAAAAGEANDEGPGGWAHEYWDVHASDGAVYRLHRDARDGRFYLDGYYD